MNKDGRVSPPLPIAFGTLLLVACGDREFDVTAQDRDEVEVVEAFDPKPPRIAPHEIESHLLLDAEAARDRCGSDVPVVVIRTNRAASEES